MKRKIRVRQTRLSDIPQLLKIDAEIWPDFRANEEMFRSRIETFPEGQFVALVNGRIVGSVFTQLINYKDWEHRTFTWDEITDFGTIRRTHNPKGDSVYGVGLAVAKKFQDRTVSHLLILCSVQQTIKMNRRRILLGARIPAYRRFSDTPPEKYIRMVRSKSGRLFDPELAIYQEYGGMPVKLLPNYINDPESLNFGVLVEWQNPLCNNPLRKIIAFILKIRPDVLHW